MKRHLIDSSNLKSVGYDPETKILEIEFKSGRVYQYSGVPEEEYDNLLNAESAGSYFAKTIRPTYSCEQVS